ncbi:MAG: glycosyltransferases involved in cell wall biogenesis [halophilic archaeon J07HX5]|jgi:Glycosyltransferases involved in cell wall biogenesis|nr:MAG: glycosyltransferases involved in cell wall biogenesis [halophilic archaeon J07HX5]
MQRRRGEKSATGAGAASAAAADVERSGTTASLEESAVKTSFVLPAYNEAGNLRSLVEEIVSVTDGESMAAYRPVEAILVDDGSTDGTADLVRELATEYEPVQGVLLRRNFGQSAALCAGLDEAIGKFVVTMDADGQNNPIDAPTLLDRLTDGYDCVSGWRANRADSLSKTLPSKIQTYLATYTGPNIHDFGCTLKAYRREAVDELQLRGEGHRYIPAKLYNRGFSITEERVDHRPRTHGSTNYGAVRLVRGFVDLGFNIFWNKYSMRPLHLLGGLGTLLLTFGGVLGSYSLVEKYVFGASLAPHLPRLILTVALVLFGFQLVMFGVLAEMLTRVIYRDETPYRIGSRVDGTTEE